MQLMGGEDEDRRRDDDPGFPTYELLLIGIGFIAGVLAWASLTGH